MRYVGCLKFITKKTQVRIDAEDRAVAFEKGQRGRMRSRLPKEGFKYLNIIQGSGLNDKASHARALRFRIRRVEGQMAGGPEQSQERTCSGGLDTKPGSKPVVKSKTHTRSTRGEVKLNDTDISIPGNWSRRRHSEKQPRPIITISPHAVMKQHVVAETKS